MEQQKLNLQLNISTELLEDIERIGKNEQRTRFGQIVRFLTDSVKQYDCGISMTFPSNSSKRKTRV